VIEFFIYFMLGGIMKGMLERVYDLNPELTKECLFNYVDVGDGMEIKLDQHISDWGESVIFSFKFEGKYVGSVDQELGGCIVHPGLETPEDDDFQFMDSCTDRIEELWNDVRKQAELHWEEKQASKI
jgi:hypothetical protein